MEMSAARYQCETKINIEDSEEQLISIRWDHSQCNFFFKCSATFYVKPWLNLVIFFLIILF